MNRIPVISSSIASIGYDGSTLEVMFRNRTVYQYFSVPQWVYEALMDASSHGQYFSEHIKDRYTYRKIR